MSSGSFQAAFGEPVHCDDLHRLLVLRAIDDRPYRYTKDILTTHHPISQMFSGGAGLLPATQKGNDASSFPWIISQSYCAFR